MVAICSGRDNETAFIATSDGWVKEFTSDMRVKSAFKTYDDSWSITTIKYLDGTGLFLTVGEKQGGALQVSLWDLNRKTKDGNQHLHSYVNVSNGSNTFPLSAFAINKDYSVMGFGYADGTVIISRGDVIHDRGARQRVVYNSSSPITGLEFYEDSDSKSTVLYVTSVSQILTVPTHGRNLGKAEVMLDKSEGCAVGCATLDSDEQTLVVARDERIVYFNSKLRGESFVFDVPKKKIFVYKQYLVLTTQTSASPTQNTVLSNLIDSSTSRVIIIDTINKYIAFSGQISNGVKEIFEQWDRINILGADGILYAVKEKDLKSRLDILKQRHLYDLAIQIAAGLNAGRSVIIQIEREFGDFLYKEGDLNEAMMHYIEAIDYGQTSQVILKYRESQHIQQLTEYLEILHNRGLATKEHTTLLLNSYAKLKDVEKLSQFIETGSSEGKFDFETAIKICRQSGYYALAAYLAQKAKESDLAVLILLRDLKDYKRCLVFIQSLDFNDALNILIQHSRTLLNELPMETTALLISLFTGKFVPKQLNLELPTTADNIIADDDNESTNSSIYNRPVLQSYRAFVNYMSTSLNGFSLGSESSSSTITTTAPGEPHGAAAEPTYQPPKPRLIFSSFIDHPSEFVIFLEACLECYDQFEGDAKSRTDLAGTLFEMYLTLANRSQSAEEKKQWQRKAKDLGMESDINRNTLLLLSHMASYNDNELLARNHDEGYEIDLFRAAAATGNVEEVKKILRNNGDKEKELYPLALTFYSSSEEILNQVGDEEFSRVLERIKRDKLMAPLQVMQALSVNSVASVGHVRKYLLELISNENTEIENNQKLATSYRQEAKNKQAEINKLLNDPIVVQYTLCSSCNTSLDLPAVHFACKHSFHQRCLTNVGDDENPLCPVCQPDIEDIRAVRRTQDELSERNDLFQSALRESDNKFRVVADFFGRGGLSTT